ncbi:MAG: SDR family oxidoreductase [Actinobacteria bacterium]|nr:SDR family oxidoreductase [Actinomycetota bacterium]
MAVALITGCSSGFGLLTALHFARAGHTVVATVREPDGATALRAASDEEDLGIDVVALDVTDPDSIERAVAGALEAHGVIDVLVNNAGISLRGAVEDTSPAAARRVLDTNVLGPLRVAQAVLPAMRARRQGVIVNVSSVAGKVAQPFAGMYSASKFALEGLSEALHYEVRPFGVRVVIVEPGHFVTCLGDNRLVADPDGVSAYAELGRRWEAAAAGLPGRDRPGDPASVAAAIYEAATTPDHPLRRLVGADAELIATLRRDLDDETFERTVRTALDFWD